MSIARVLYWIIKLAARLLFKLLRLLLRAAITRQKRRRTYGTARWVSWFSMLKAGILSRKGIIVGHICGRFIRYRGDAWTEEHVALYQKRWPLGTRQRVWLDVLLYSGLRRGDAVRYGRQHVRNGVGRIPTEKSKLQIIAVVPVLPILAKTLEAGPTGEMTFICGANGNPLTKESFGNLFRDACNEAGVPGSAHGVRKIAATTAANNGATVAQLKALFGWTSDSMAALYTRSADRDRLARDAGHMLGNAERTSIPAPKRQVRARTKKS